MFELQININLYVPGKRAVFKHAHFYVTIASGNGLGICANRLAAKCFFGDFSFRGGGGKSGPEGIAPARFWGSLIARVPV
ncbi:MAG: hypothetical protein DBX55_08675 [Verrucomicrobia bacterium]|nr:MAG: hypothetical protein DBX55_08675 [Verrucomicrobiota bacterium]